MSPIRIFVSYDENHDSDLRDLLQSQSAMPGSPFEFAARSEGGEMTEAWTERSRAQIRGADEVVMICGVHTKASTRMAAELRITREEDKPCMLLWGRRELMCTKPDGARPADVMYSWTRKILESQLSETLRHAKPRDLPERRKRG